MKINLGKNRTTKSWSCSIKVEMCKMIPAEREKECVCVRVCACVCVRESERCLTFFVSPFILEQVDLTEGLNPALAHIQHS